MPTPTGLPKVGEVIIVVSTGQRHKVLERTTNDRHCSVKVEDTTQAVGYRYIVEVMHYLNVSKSLRLEES